MDKRAIWMGATLGGFIGGIIPGLWHADFLSLWSIIFSTVGGLFGIWAVAKLYN